MYKLSRLHGQGDAAEEICRVGTGHFVELVLLHGVACGAEAPCRCLVEQTGISRRRSAAVRALPEDEIIPRRAAGVRSITASQRQEQAAHPVRAPCGDVLSAHDAPHEGMPRRSASA